MSETSSGVAGLRLCVMAMADHPIWVSMIALDRVAGWTHAISPRRFEAQKPSCDSLFLDSQNYDAFSYRITNHKALENMRKPGAGEGIRTLDPNLGKVVR